MASGSLLIYVSVPLHRGQDGGLLLEDQACNGLRLWAENFDKLIVLIPLATGPAPESWVPIAKVGPALTRCEIIPIPVAWTLGRFLRVLPQVRTKVRDAIGRADRMGFAIGGLVGDWGAVAAWEAHRKGRPFFVWTDRVESAVTRHMSKAAPRFKTRLKARVVWRPMAALERAVIRCSALGLFHGQETFDHYAPFSRNPQMVHDIHLSLSDHLPPAEVPAKQTDTALGRLRVLYVGRADPMKGAADWIEAVARALAEGADIEAEWIGDGPALPQMRARILSLGLEGRIRLTGQVTDRGAVKAALRRAQVFLFCHQTPESPRCLIEALAMATPIVGYQGGFAQQLIARAGGGKLLPKGDIVGLSAALLALDADRPSVADLIGRAARDREGFDDVSIFRHRSDLIKAYLPGPQEHLPI